MPTRKKLKTPAVAFINKKARDAARYWGAECQANPGTSLMGDYAYDIALKYGRKSWAEMTLAEKSEALRAFAEGRAAEKKLQ